MHWYFSFISALLLLPSVAYASLQATALFPTSTTSRQSSCTPGVTFREYPSNVTTLRTSCTCPSSARIRQHPIARPLRPCMKPCLKSTILSSSPCTTESHTDVVVNAIRQCCSTRCGGRFGNVVIASFSRPKTLVYSVLGCDVRRPYDAECTTKFYAEDKEGAVAPLLYQRCLCVQGKASTPRARFAADREVFPCMRKCMKRKNGDVCEWSQGTGDAYSNFRDCCSYCSGREDRILFGHYPSGKRDYRKACIAPPTPTPTPTPSATPACKARITTEDEGSLSPFIWQDCRCGVGAASGTAVSAAVDMFGCVRGCMVDEREGKMCSRDGNGSDAITVFKGCCGRCGGVLGTAPVSDDPADGSRSACVSS